MPWVVFSERYDHRPLRNLVQCFQPGVPILVTTRCADEAIAKGKATKVAKPKPHPSESRHIDLKG